MLNEHQINFLPERIAQRISDINSEYLENIGTVIKKIGELRPKDVHQLQRMYNYGADMEKVIAKLSSVSGKNAQEIYDIFNIVAKENYDYSEPFYKAQGMKFIPYEQNEDLQRYVNSLAKQTVDEYINITQHTAFAVFAANGKSIAPLFEANKNKLATSLSDTYTKLVDYAVTKVQLGEESYTKAMRDVVKAMVNSGIKTVDYATGYSRSIESAVRQNILWGVKQCNQNTADMIGEEFGADGYEIDYHSNPRPSHADMGGGQFAKGPARTIDGVYYPSFEKEAEPLLNEYGCLHFKFSILLGISVPTHTKEQLEEFKARDKQTFEFEGHKYTAYEGKQLQGRIESAIKYQKDLANTAKKAGDDDLRREAQYNINVLTNKYAKLSEASGLPTRMERLQMAGFRPVNEARTASGQAKYKAIINRATDEEQYKRYVGILGADRMPKTIDEFQKIKYNNSDRWSVLKQEYRIVNQYKIDSGTVSVQTILDMDNAIIREKRNNFPSKYKKSGNIAGVYIDTDPKLFLAHSKIDDITDKGFANYKGTSNIVLLQPKRNFRYIDVLMPDGTIRQGTYYDTEAKLFEELHILLRTHSFHEITMLSERGMCDSCLAVMEQFKKAHPNIKVNVVSNKKVNANVWKYRLRK